MGIDGGGVGPALNESESTGVLAGDDELVGDVADLGEAAGDQAATRRRPSSTKRSRLASGTAKVAMMVIMELLDPVRRRPSDRHDATPCY